MNCARTLIAAMLLMSSSYSVASECVLSITRTPCPGKDAEAFKPYDGKATTEERKVMASADACAKAGEKASQIVRKGVLSAKSVEAKFDGAMVGGSPFAGKAACE